MTGHPPDDGSFPGRPGEPPFPGPPGGGPPRRQPPAPAPQHLPVPPPQGPAVPGPPGPAAHPGHPGPPRQSNRGPRRGLWIGVAAGAGLLLVACAGLVAWSVAEARPYAALPSCDDLLSADLLETVPSIDRPRAEGEFVDVDDLSYEDMGGDGYRGSLDCTVYGASDAHVMNVHLALYDAEDGAGAIEDIREEIEDGILDLEEERFGEDLPGQDFEVDVFGWRELSAGDGGYAMVADYTDGEWSSGGVHAQAYFSSANVVISVGHPQDGRVDEEEFLGFFTRFAAGVERQLSREGERV